MATGNFTIPIKPSVTNTWDTSWTKPADWLDISSVGNNEINLLVTDGTGIAFATTLIASGTYSIDWGDGTIETNRASGTIYQHQYTYGSGSASSIGSLYKIKIYNASTNITGWSVSRHTYTNRTQYLAILWVVFGTVNLTTCVNLFTATNAYCTILQKVTLPVSCTTIASYQYSFYQCYSLQSVDLPTVWGPCTTVYAMFHSCYSLTSVIIPSNWGSIITAFYMFINCYSLTTITLPTSWGSSMTNIGAMFQNCYSLTYITLPTSWGSITQSGYLFTSCNGLKYINIPSVWGIIQVTEYMFGYCTGLTKINLPITWGSITNIQYMFEGCISLLEINLPTSWGNVTNVTRMLRGCASLTKLTLPSLWGSVNTVYGFLSYNIGIANLTLPTSWGLITDISSLFHQMNGLTNVTLPTTWGTVYTINGLFTNCYQLESVTLPSTQFNSMNACSNVFGGCYSLKNVVNLDKMGSTTTQTEMGQVLQDCEFYSSAVNISARLASFGMYGTVANVLDVTSIRFTNGANSLFNTSYYPATYPYHVNVSYTSLDATALNNLFGDLPTLVGKTINITGCPGAATCTRSIATGKGWTITG